MERSRFEYVCMESEAGRDAVVINQGEQGLVDRCAGDHLVVKMSTGGKRCWDYRECVELSRTNEEFPWR